MISKHILEKELENLINQIPKGKVTTFKQLALALGDIYARKYVYQTYKKLNAPWWRVVNEKGEIKDQKQEELLKKEGINIKNHQIVNLKDYLFSSFVSSKPLEKLRKIQKELAQKIVLNDGFDKIDYIGGVDLSYKDDNAIVAYVILEYPSLKVIEEKTFHTNVNFPYIPTFLAFREGEPIIKTFHKLSTRPDILFVNGQGIAHPFKLGLASYIGVILDIPTIGVTKKHLFGRIKDNKIYDREGKQIGWVLKKDNKIIYVSPGHKVSLDTSRELIEKTWVQGAYPEPIRLADLLSKRAKRRESDLRKFL